MLGALKRVYLAASGLSFTVEQGKRYIGNDYCGHAVKAVRSGRGCVSLPIERLAIVVTFSKGFLKVSINAFFLIVRVYYLVFWVSPEAVRLILLTFNWRRG